MKRLILVLSGCLIVMLSFSHPVSLTWANVRIDGTKITVHYKFLAEDLILFHHPGHDGKYNYDVKTLTTLIDFHKNIVVDNFIVETADKKLSDAQILSVDHDFGTLKTINKAELMRYEVVMVYQLSLATDQWSELVFRQLFGKEDAHVPVVTFLSVSEGDRDLLSNGQLSPENPIRVSRFGDNDPISYSELTSSYLSVSTGGIRHELTIPLNIFQSFLETTETPNEPILTDYFKNYNPVFGNDQFLAPVISDFRLINSTETAGIIYMDIRYPTMTYPTKAEIHWDDYNWKFRWFESSLITSDSVYNHTFSRYQPVLQWELKLTSPEH